MSLLLWNLLVYIVVVIMIFWAYTALKPKLPEFIGTLIYIFLIIASVIVLLVLIRPVFLGLSV